jgi:ligand-binding sensor domain-containing protein
MKKLCLALLISCCIILVSAQTNPWTYQTWHGAVKAFAPEGDQLWIGTEGGIIRYDLLTHEQTEYLCTDQGVNFAGVSTIYIDPQGIKWVAFMGTGVTAGALGRFDGTEWTLYTQANSGYPGAAACITSDSQNNLWLGSGSGLYKFDGTDWTEYTTSNSGLANRNVTAIAIDSLDVIWVGTGAYGLNRFNGVDWYYFPFPSNYYSRTNILKFDQQGILWVGCRYAMSFHGTLFAFDGQNFSYPEMLLYYYNYGLVGIEWDSDGNMWVSADGVVSCYDGIAWTHYTHSDSGLTGTDINAFTIDDYDTKWFGKYQGTIQTLSGGVWSDITLNNCFDFYSSPYAFGIDDQNTLYMVNMFGIHSFDGINWHSFDLESSDSWFYLPRKILFDSNGTFWFACHRGVVSLGGNTVNEYDLYSMFNASINDMAVDSNDNIILATNRGLIVYDGYDWNLYDSSNSDFPGSVVYAVCYDGEGNMWTSVGNVGLVKYDGTDYTIYTQYNSGLPNRNIKLLFADTAGNLWIACEGNAEQTCLVKFDGTNWNVYQMGNGDIPCDYIYNIIEDNYGNVWFGTMYGLMRYTGSGFVMQDVMYPGFNVNALSWLDSDSQGRIWVSRRGLHILDYQTTALGDEVIQINPAMKISPNPFSASTSLSLELAKTGRVEVSVYNLKGQKITTLADGFKEAGKHVVNWDGTDRNGVRVSSGVYFIRVKADGYIRTAKCMLIR